MTKTNKAKKIPEPITLTPETPSVVSWKKQLEDRPTDYHVGIVTGDPSAVDASHHYACRLILEDRGLVIDTRGNVLSLSGGPDGRQILTDYDGNTYTRSLGISYEAPVAFEDLVKALTQQEKERDDYHMEQDDHAAGAGVLSVPDEVIDLDEEWGYRDGILTALAERFGRYPEVCCECLDKRLTEAYFTTGIYSKGTLDVGPNAGQQVTFMNLHKQLMQDPEVQKADQEVDSVVVQLRAARRAFNVAWAKKLMAEHKAAWEQGVAEADKYASLLKDLFEEQQALAAD